MHNDLKIDDKQFTMRTKILYAFFMEPVDLFKNLVIALYRQIIVRLLVLMCFSRRW
jgi:hypothetical protein